MPGQKFHHSLKEHHKISEIDNREIDNQMIKLIINFPFVIQND
jgi:hypothetical protein